MSRPGSIRSEKPMNQKGETEERKCFEFVCPLYPKCGRAAGSCCALDDFFEVMTITAEECLERQDKPYYDEKKRPGFYRP